MAYSQRIKNKTKKKHFLIEEPRFGHEKGAFCCFATRQRTTAPNEKKHHLTRSDRAAFAPDSAIARKLATKGSRFTFTVSQHVSFFFWSERKLRLTPDLSAKRVIRLCESV